MIIIIIKTIKNIYKAKKMCYNSNMTRIDDVFLRYELDAVLISNAFNVKYVCGYVADYCYALIARNAKYFFTDGRFTIEANRDLESDWNVVEIKPTSAAGVIGQVISDLKLNKVGYDGNLMHSEYLFVVGQLLADVQKVDITDWLTDCRAIKSEYEIEQITKAQRIAEKSLQQLKSEIREGMTELELCARLEYLMKVNGSVRPSFDTIVAFGENSAIAHAKPGNRQLKYGDVILIDFGATYNGYCSDMTRTFVFGGCSEEFEQIYNAVLGANEIAISCIRSGIPLREADRVARNYLDLHNLAPYFTHSLGHGVGLQIHEYPSLSPNDTTDNRLQDGMVVTIEPGVYFEGRFGIRIEDMIVVRGANCINLTTSDKNLEIINN